MDTFARQSESQLIMEGQDMYKFERENSQIYQEIVDLLAQRQKCQKQKESDLGKIRKLKEMNSKARATLDAAEKKLEKLRKKNEMMKETLECTIQRTNLALEYWKNFGLEVREIKSDGATQEYEYIYLKTSDMADSYVIRVKVSENLYVITSQEPPIFNESELDELSIRLTSNCINDGKVDYKLGMLLIRKAIKNCSSSTKICEHQPAETNSHTCN